MAFDIANIEIPEFEKHLRTPRNLNCKEVDVNNIVAEVLGGEHHAEDEIQGSQMGEKVLLQGAYSILLRYKRIKDGQYYPTIAMGFDSDEEGEIIIRHIQGVKIRGVGFEFSAGFDGFGYFLECIKHNFTAKGIRVSLPIVPTNLEGASYASMAPLKYDQLRKKIETLNDSIDT